MCEPRYRDWILETIDSLRSRKARPDLERICRMVRRRHGSDPDRTRAELEKLIQERTVLKVNYKGSVSYRNAAKVQRKCRRKIEAGERTAHAAFCNNNSGEQGDARSPADREERDMSPRGEKREAEEEGEEGEKNSSRTFGEEEEKEDASCDTSSPAAGDGQEEEEVVEEEEEEEEEARSGGDAAADLGDRLVAAVWSLSSRTRAHAQPLGIKEILGYLAHAHPHMHADREKLTRHRVKVVLEREIERGRLRRTRLGHITVPARKRGGPVRGLGGSQGVARVSSARLPASNSAPQDGQSRSKKEEEKGEEPVEMESEEDEKVEKESQASDPPEPQSVLGVNQAEVEDHTHTPPTAGLEGRTCDVTPIATVSDEQLLPLLPSSSSLSSSSSSSLKTTSVHQEEKECGAEGNLGEMMVKAESVNTGISKKDKSSVIPEQLHTPTQDQVVVVSDSVKILPSIPFNSYSSCKTEVGVSSCLLTPSASPGAAEDRGLNGGVFVKSESSGANPVDWTVADVVSYFTAVGFPEQALAFRMQEIDGKSLLLMQRNDVLTGLSIRLGPALKIYERHVKVLQRTHFQDDEAFC